MSVRIVTNVGTLDFEVFYKACPRTAFNFIKLCKLDYYAYSLFLRLEAGFIVQGGDPTNSGNGGESIWAKMNEEAGTKADTKLRFFDDEIDLSKSLNHSARGTLSMASAGKNRNASQFFVTLANDLSFLDGQSTCFGQLIRFEPSEKIQSRWKSQKGENTSTDADTDMLERFFTFMNDEAMVDEQHRPLQDIYIVTTQVLNDPFPDPVEFTKLLSPARKPPTSKPTAAFVKHRRIAADEFDESAELAALKEKRPEEAEAERREKEAAGNALVLELLGDLPSAHIKPPENILFVCRLNPVTRSSDLKLIFSRFGAIRSCDVIVDHETNASLCYAFIEFEHKEACEQAYMKMDNVVVDDRRIRVDFSQSVSRLHRDWLRRRAEPARQRHDSRSNTTSRRHEREHEREGRRARSRTRSPPRSRSRSRSRSQSRYQSRSRR